MRHAKALGDVWLDSVVNIGAYWLGAQLVQASAPRPVNSATTWRWTLPAHFPPGHRVRARVEGGSLMQNGKPLAWDEHGFYEVVLDAGSLSWQP
jgi:hypothetical protein